MPYLLLADAVLIAHLALVVFVLLGLLLIVLGHGLGWRWVRGRWFRRLHLAAIGVVVAESWLGITCPLTTLENWLRLQAGQAGYAGGFIANGVQQILFYDAPGWVFMLAYTGFAALVLLMWWRCPPERRRRR